MDDPEYRIQSNGPLTLETSNDADVPPVPAPHPTRPTAVVTATVTAASRRKVDARWRPRLDPTLSPLDGDDVLFMLILLFVLFCERGCFVISYVFRCSPRPDLAC